MAIGSFVYRRGDTYSFRAKTPVSVRGRVPRREVLFALGTSDEKIARALCAVIGVRIDMLWRDVAAMVDTEEVERHIREWFQTELDRAWRDNFRDPARDAVVQESINALYLDKGDEKEGEKAPVVDFERERARYASSVALGQLAHIEDGIRTVEQMRGIAREVTDKVGIPSDDRRVDLIARTLLAGEYEVAEAILHWSDGHTDFRPDWTPELPEGDFPRPAPAPVVKVKTARRSSRKERPDAAGLTLTQAFDRYAKERKPKPDTVAGHSVSIRRFVELHGDLDVAHITKRHVAEFKDALLQFPARLGPDERSMSFKAVLARYNGRDDVKRLTAATVNAKHVSGVSVALQWASENGRIETVVSRGVRAKAPASEKKVRLPYAANDLGALFALPVFTADERPLAAAGEAAVWLPLLALYTGARLDELGTLNVGDVVQVACVDAISIRDGKTKNARRKVPLHRELKRLGFLDYVATRRKAGAKDDDALFPMIASKSKKTATGPFGAWWGRYARKAVPDHQKTFHSFRHTVKRALRNAGVDKTLRDAVMGHEAKDVADRYGLDEEGGGYEVASLAKAIDALEYPGLTINLAPVPPAKPKRYRRTRVR